MFRRFLMSHDKQINGAKTLKEEIRVLSEKMQERMQTTGRFRRWLNRVFHNKPRSEIFHDWHLVMSFYDRVVESADNYSGKDSDKERLNNLALIDAYLNLSRYERNFARAWTFINLATTLLVLVVEPEDERAAVFRLERHKQKETLRALYHTQSSKLAAVQSHLKLMKDEKDPARLSKYISDALPLLADIETQLEKIYARFDDQLPAPETDEDKKNRHFAYVQQLCQAQDWNTRNVRISLRLSLWKFIGLWLTLALTAVVLLTTQGHLWFTPGQIRPLYYIAMVILGFFGGGLSAFVTTRQTVVNIPNCRIIKAHTLLRMLMGAAGAFVIFPIVQWLPLGDISAKVLSSLPVFITLGIVAGFSERLFINALEKIADNLSSGVEEKMKPDSRPEPKPADSEKMS